MKADICFVCGSKGASGVLHIRPPADGGSYFSFLESHVAPRGARQPNANGQVNACTVCSAFLNQQWDAFERTRTPLIKRLYWLKRIDNGTFTGAEMSLQGEYVAQLMGLHGGLAGAGSFDCGSHSGIPCRDAPSPTSVQEDGEDSGASDGAVGVLDLSVSPAKPPREKRKRKTPIDRTKSPSAPRPITNGGRKKNGSIERGNNTNIVCYVCGSSCPNSLARFIYAVRPAPEEPYFPFLLTHPMPSGAMPLTRAGVTQVCADCRKSLTRQWRSFESRGTAHHVRTYRIGDVALIPPTDGDENCTQRQAMCTATISGEVCYLCGEPSNTMEWISTRPNSDNVTTMVLPFIAQLKCPTGARPISTDGRVHVCVPCFNFFSAQWHDYDTKGVATDRRTFVLRPVLKPNGWSSSLTPEKDMSKAIVDCPLLATALSNGDWLDAKFRALNGQKPRSSTPRVNSRSGTSNGTSEETLVKPVSEINGDRSTVNCNICDVECNRVSGDDPTRSSFLVRFEPTDNSANENQEDSKLKLSRPFFPTLARLPGCNRNVSCRSALCCAVCYANLMRQWNRYEASSSCEGSNRWLRPYQLTEYVCGVCQRIVERGRVTARKSNRPIDNVFFELVCVDCSGQSRSIDHTNHKFSPDPHDRMSPSASFYQSATKSSELRDRVTSRTPVTCPSRDSSQHDGHSPAILGADLQQQRPLSGSRHLTNGRHLNSHNSQSSDCSRSTVSRHSVPSDLTTPAAAATAPGVGPAGVPASTAGPQFPASLLSQTNTAPLCSPAMSSLLSNASFATDPMIFAHLISSAAKLGLGYDSIPKILLQSYLLQQQQQQHQQLMSLQFPGLVANGAGGPILPGFPAVFNNPGFPGLYLGATNLTNQTAALVGQSPLQSGIPNLFSPQLATLNLQQQQQQNQQQQQVNDIGLNRTRTPNGLRRSPVEDVRSASRAGSSPGRSSSGNPTPGRPDCSTSRSRPIFHRPFLDDDRHKDATEESSRPPQRIPCNEKNSWGGTSRLVTAITQNSTDILTAAQRSESPPQTCIDFSTQRKPVCRSYEGQKNVEEVGTRELQNGVDGFKVRDVGTRCQQVTVNEAGGRNQDVDAGGRDRRLSAALGLISLAGDVTSALSDFTESDGSSCHSDGYTSMTKRPKLDISPTTKNVYSHQPMTSRCASSVLPLSDPLTRFTWPGVEAVMEAYVRHVQDEKLELSCLFDQQQQLVACHEQLVHTAGSLDTQLTELQDANEQLTVERQQLQTTISRLKQYLHV